MPYTVYDPEYHPRELIRCMELGELDIQIIAKFDISKKTFYKWLKDHEEFKEAYEKGLVKCEAAWDKKGIEYMENDRDKPFRYWIAVKNNKFGWAEKKNEGTTININQVNVLDQKTTQELLEYVQDKTARLKDLGVLDAEYKLLDKPDSEQ